MENEKDEPNINLKKRRTIIESGGKGDGPVRRAERTRREKPLALMDTDRIWCGTLMGES